MQHFYVLQAKHWKKWATVIVFALFAAVFIWSELNVLSTLSSTNQETVLAKGNKDEPHIGLTFNISWGEEKVHDILEQLEKNDVQATFFVSGEWAERHPDILEKISEGKHELGMLGYRYKSYLDQDTEQVKKDLEKAKKIFKKLGYENISLIRPPSGHFNKEIIELAEDRGLKVIHWNVNPVDWKNPGSDKITDTVMKQTKNGDIILMHASDTVTQTDDALKTILK